MGGKSSKKSKKEQSPNTITAETENTINLTNNVIIGHSKSDPNEEYSKLNFLGEGSFAAVYKVQNKLTGQIRAMKTVGDVLSAICRHDDMQSNGFVGAAGVGDRRFVWHRSRMCRFGFSTGSTGRFVRPARRCP